ncbi:Uncharacterised protein [Lysinibacillus sphaericus]|nr:Uncharacterised protein [Lysinibacillus sphaericus]
MGTFNAMKASEAQRNYIERTGSPKFPPAYGTCWNCNKNIYELYYWKFECGQKRPANEEDFTLKSGITVEKAGESLVTGCPHCNRSYCD